jgi:sarcosine oxidase, subunit alpha
MTSSRRLETGGRIDRSRRISFQFDGKTYHGFAGDTVASALLAAGVRLVARSFRLHRPRGTMSSGLEESNALVHVRVGKYEEPNARATLTPLRPGLEVFSQNAWPSREWDFGAFFDLLPKLWSAGFYHKVFIWPGWHWYEPFIRRVAGIGRICSADAATGVPMQRDMDVDVAVCGGGLAGMSAALAAAEAGASVALLHADGELGGRGVGDPSLSRRLAEHANVEVLTGALAVGVFGERVVLAEQGLGEGPEGPRRCLMRIRARSLVVAAGALEQPLVFEHNDRPGVMLAGAVTRYLERYAVRAGHTMALITNNDRAYEALGGWRAAGLEIAAIVDSREAAGDAARAIIKRLGVPLFLAPGGLAVEGRSCVKAVRVVSGEGRVERIACDLVAMSGGWVPSVHLYSQALGALEYEPGLHAYVPGTGPPGLYAVGAAAGLEDRADIAAHANAVGRAAAFCALEGKQLEVAMPTRPTLSPAPTRLPGKPHRQWLDFQHDVTVYDANAAVEQGYTHVEHFKRYTTTGMAIDQGKTSQRNALEVLAQLTGRSLETLRPPTYRAPFAALSLATAAGPNQGPLYRPEKRLPCHAEHVALGAHFEDVGGWRRPLHYGRGSPSDIHASVEGEARAVRTAAGLFDSSPLGKIEVSGPDALEFLNRLYVNNLTTLSEGRVRYVLMLRDNGTVMDDGTVARIGPEEYLVTTTGGNFERVALWMREWAECEWPALNVIVTPVTTAWGSVTLSGPKARAILKRAGTSIDIRPEAFPHMTFRSGDVAGVPARVYRVSFTGEVSFEINVPARQTATLWRALLAAGRTDGLLPYGVDALNVLRTEKGYLHIGVDTDATTTALDLGWGALIERKAGDFIGRSALALAEYQRPDRLQLVGLAPLAPHGRLVAGAHLIPDRDRRRSEGYVTSACGPLTLANAVALARLERGRERLGEVLLAYDQGATTPVRVVEPTFYDPKNLLLQG